EMAGFPPSRAPKSHEYPKSPSSRGFPKSHESPEYPVSLVSPVSNGQGLDGEREPLAALERLAARYACAERNTARKRRWKLVRDLRAVEKGIGRQLSNGELMRVFNKWYCDSQAFLDRGKTRDDYLAAFLAELGKVRVPTGEGDTLKKALEFVST